MSPSASGRACRRAPPFPRRDRRRRGRQRPRSRRHHQRGAERRGMEAVVDGQAFAAGLPFARRHRLVGDEQVVQPAGAGQADLVGGVEHARGIAQQLARAVERERLQERLRRQPGPAAEQMVQLGRRDAGGFGDLLDLRLRAPVASDVSDGAAHDVVVGGGGWTAAPRSEMRSGESMACLHHVALHLGRQQARNPPDFWPASTTTVRRRRRAWPRRARADSACGEAFLFLRRRESPRSGACGRARPGTAAHAEFLVRLAIELRPERIERPFRTSPRWLTLRSRQLRGRDRDLLVGRAAR